MWESSEVVHVKALINRSSVAMCTLEVVEILLRYFVYVFCSVNPDVHACNVECLLYVT